METARENGGSFGVDLNENEEGDRGGGETGKCAVRDRSIALLAGVSGGQDSGKPLTGNGRNVNCDAAFKGEIMLERLFLGQVSGVCGNHSGLNGFTEEELPVVALEGGGRGGGGGLGLEGTTAASCPAVLSVEKMRGHSEGETRDSDCVTAEGEATGGGCLRTSLPRHEVSCAGRKHRRSCPCTAGANMPNGAVDSSEGGVGLFPTQHFCLCNCEEVTVANGGFHTREQGPDSPESPPDSQFPLESWRDEAVGLPGSSAKLPSPCPSPGGSPLSEPDIRGEEEEGDEEGFSDPSSPPVRPLTLRTNPNVTVSLSCDATPLAPEDEEDGGFYFEGYDEDLRGVLEAGRRQSAPDHLPDLNEDRDGSDPKQMPKRFGIADFFTR